jgi:hypothetical protein
MRLYGCDGLECGIEVREQRLRLRGMRRVTRGTLDSASRDGGVEGGDQLGGL